MSTYTYHSRSRTQARAPRAAAALTFLVVVAAAIRGAAAQQIFRDERFRAPPTPTSLDEFVARFAPIWVSVAPVVSRRMFRLQTMVVEYDVVGGVCYQAMASGPELMDVDLRVRVDGELVAQDVQFDDYPAARFCAARTGTIEVTVDAFEGSGDIALGLFAEPSSLDAASGALDELSNRIDASVARTAPEWMPVGSQQRTRFDGPGTTDLGVSFGEAGCYALIAVAEAALDDIDLLLLDAADNPLAVDVALDATPAVVYCPPAPTRLTARIASAEGAGTVALQVLAAPR